MHGPVWICPSVSQRVELLKLKATFEAFEADKFYSVIVQHQGTATNSVFLDLPAFKNLLPTSEDDWNWIGERYGFPVSAIAAYGKEAPEKAKIYRRFYFLSNMPRVLFDAIGQAGNLIGDWTAFSKVPKCTRDFPIPAGVWMGLLYDKFTDPSIAPDWWIPGQTFKFSKEIHGAFITIPNIATYSLRAIDVLAGKRWNGRSIYRAPVAKMLQDSTNELNDRLAVLHYLILELQKAWPSPTIHGIDAPQLEIDLVWELLSTVPVIESSPLPNLRFPSQEDLAYWDRSEETEQQIRNAFAIYHESVGKVLLALLKHRSQESNESTGTKENSQVPDKTSDSHDCPHDTIQAGEVENNEKGQNSSVPKGVIEERELLKQRWLQFKEDYKSDKFTRVSHANFVLWLKQKFDTETHDEGEVKSELDAHRKWEERHEKAGRESIK
ncbi:hypothetical protein Pan97_34760 [Bremerella volcania]|uniref:Uncharacterized protein n=1 Tax=Bremerella volcania TaxID=2527984 RepID=A0A518CB30_9BACT|nr:hypothetical protein [Bremerella volcania]QDU76427.1 hypothetical protein Pan97_34760 [Bremerella volcania]